VLSDVPQDDAAERVGDWGGDVFTLPEQTPALVAVRGVVETALVASPAGGGRISA